MRKIDEDYAVVGWLLQGVDFANAPSSLQELSDRFRSTLLPAQDLIHAPKWEPLFRGPRSIQRAGWVPLSKLASTRRGIATGANAFFLLTPDHAKALDIRPEMLLPCVGRSLDVPGLIFADADYRTLVASNAKCLLLNLTGDLTAAEESYVAAGEADGLLNRYLLANRKPWYSMEQRKPAPIWAAVFGRGDLGFVYNEAGARSLTNFHCVYPSNSCSRFARALTTVLNSPSVQIGAREHIRGYGGGLMKFEPNDLRPILVPDLGGAGDATLDRLSAMLDILDRAKRDPVDLETAYREIDGLVAEAAQEAASYRHTLL